MIVDLVKNTALIEVRVGPRGRAGINGVGVPTGGTTGQILAKNSGASYDTEWIDAPTSGASSWDDITGKPSTFPPGGGAGGVLSGTYPNPGFAVNMATQAELDAVSAELANKADLVGGVIPTAQIPAIAITSFLGSVASQSAMLALSGQTGDWCNRADTSTAWVIVGSDPTQLSSWAQINYPASPVTSVNGQVGVIVLGKSDIGLGNVDNTSDANKPVSTATATALAGKANTAHTHIIDHVAGLQSALDAKAGAEISNAVAQVVQIDVLAGEASQIQSQYVQLDTGTGLATLWINAGGFGSAPGVIGTLYEVAVGMEADGSAVASVIATVISGIAGLSASVLANVVTVTASSEGVRSAPFGSDLNLTATETTAGVDPVNRLEATSGELLTALNASQITTGTLSADRLANASISNAKLANSEITINGTPVSLGGSQTLATGLANITETLLVSSPNNTVNAERLAVTGGTTNTDLVLTPKGTGAFIVGAAPDGTATGGNKPGSGSIQLVIGRTVASEAATGANAIAVGGKVTASSQYAVALGGFCTASTVAAVAIGGRPGFYGAGCSAVEGIAIHGTASGDRGIAIGKTAVNSAADGFATQAGSTTGQFGFSSGQFSVASLYGSTAHAAGRFSASGDAQYSMFVARNKTTTNSAVELFLDGGATRLSVASGKIFSGTVNIVGSKSDGTAVARYLRQVTIKNASGTTSLVGSVITLGTDEAAGTSISITANDTNDALRIEVTGVASETWRWVATIQGAEISYGN